MEKNNFISVIMPAHNAEEFIAESINSVLSQTYSNFELLVVDDASTDDTRKIVEKFASIDSRVLALKNIRMKGVSGTRNTGIAKASGEWIAFLDSDDVWYPDMLKQRVLVARKYPDCDAITSNYNIWFPDDNVAEVPISKTNAVWAKYFSESNKTGINLKMFKPIDEFLESVLTHTSVIMVKEELLKSLGGFDESLHTYEDVHLWLKVAAYSEYIMYIPKIGSKYRQRKGSLTHSGEPVAKGAIDAFRKLLNDPAFNNHRVILDIGIRHQLMLNTYWYRKNGYKVKAIRSAIESHISDPLSKETFKNLIASLIFR